MYSLVNSEMNGSKKNEIIEVQNKIDGHKYNHSVMTESKITMTMMMIRGKN